MQELECNHLYTENQPLMLEWTNHSSFYAVYPTYLYQFAQNWLRKWLQWYDGYVPEVHEGKNGIISTGLARTLVNKLADQVNGSGVLFAKKNDNEESSEALTFISSKYEDDTGLSEDIHKAITLAAAGGTSYIKLNIDKDERLWQDVWRADQCYCDFDSKGHVTRGKFLIAKFIKAVPNKAEYNQNFYIVEERFRANEQDNKNYIKTNAKKIKRLEVYPTLEIGKPYVVYNIYRLTGVITSQNLDGISMGRPLNWEEIPDDIKQSIIEDYGNFKVNVPKKIALPTLGIYPFKWTPYIHNLCELPFGESAIDCVMSYLFEYDVMNSCMNTDFYLGRGRVIVPKQMQSPTNKKNTQNYNEGLDNFIFTKLEYNSIDDQKPVPLQFEIRSGEWLQSRNNLLESIATAIGISPSTIASYLNDSSNRTAREISSEESATSLYVENKRKLMTKPINDLIGDILIFNGYTEEVVVKFSKSGQTNVTLLTENITKQYQAGLISKYQAVKMLNPDMAEDELKDEIKRIDEEEEQRNSMFNDMNEFNQEEGQFEE